jgi:hypothetical protein
MKRPPSKKQTPARTGIFGQKGLKKPVLARVSTHLLLIGKGGV